MARVELPKQFADLGEWGPEWFGRSDQERHVQRVTSDLAPVRRFYESVLPRMDEIIAYLNNFPTNSPDTLSEPDCNLYYLALNCMEMSHPIDMKWKNTDIDDTFPWQRFGFLPLTSR